MTLVISNKRRTYEILAVCATAIGKWVFMDYLQWKLLFVIFASTAWALYVAFQVLRKPLILKVWGFRWDNAKEVLSILWPFALTCFVLCVGIGIFQQTIHITWHILPILLLYPLWGIVQQFLIMALVAGNLSELSAKINKLLIVLATALLFGVVHYPDKWLMIGTFILALFYGYVFLRTPNVFILGIFHGWLGGLFYYTVVNRDPFMEVFGRYF
jgi:uncharacterized protein